MLILVGTKKQFNIQFSCCLLGDSGGIYYGGWEKSRQSVIHQAYHTTATQRWFLPRRIIYGQRLRPGSDERNWMQVSKCGEKNYEQYIWATQRRSTIMFPSRWRGKNNFHGGYKMKASNMQFLCAPVCCVDWLLKNLHLPVGMDP